MRKLQWLTVVIPALTIVAYIVAARPFFDRIQQLPAGSFIIVGLGVAGAYLFSNAVFNHVSRLQRALEERNKALSALYAIAAKTASSLHPYQVLELAVDEAMAVLRADAVGIYLVDENGGAPRLEVYRSARGDPLPRGMSEVAWCGCTDVVRRREPVMLNVQDSLCHPLVDDATGSPQCISVPIISGDRALGAMFVILHEPLPVGSQTVDMMVAIGQQVGTALETARLHEATETVAVLRERNRVALELHDGLAQVLGGIALKSQVVQGLLSRGDLVMAQAELGDLRAAATEAFRDVREAILDLRTTIGPNRGFFDTLGEYVRRFSSQNRLPVQLNLPEDNLFPFGAAAQVQVLRILQEALNNVRKYAPNSQVVITFVSDSTGMRMIVEDDGPGFDPSKVEKEKHLGLESMAERAKSIGADFQLETAKGKGTRVTVTLPKESHYVGQAA